MLKINKKRIGILFGGRSSEHEVSVASANSILNVIDTAKYEIELIGITKKGEWVVADDARKLLNGEQVNPSSRLFIPADPVENKFAVLDNKNDAIDGFIDRLDAVFPVLHGPYGEDGTIQGLFEIVGIPYVGAGVAASAVGMDKILMKHIFIAHGLPTADSIHFLRKDWHSGKEQLKQLITGKIKFPCFVKPANAGSSVGITKVHSLDELDSAVELAAEFDRKILVERCIEGREIECSVLGNDHPEASVPGEIIPSNEFYDYDAKYINESSELIIPAKLSNETTKRVRELSVMAFKALDCAGMARVDFLIEESTGKVYLSEINTIPGFTSISMYPKMWEASGLTYTDLVKKLIDLAFERFEDTMLRKTSYFPSDTQK